MQPTAPNKYSMLFSYSLLGNHIVKPKKALSFPALVTGQKNRELHLMLHDQEVFLFFG